MEDLTEFKEKFPKLYKAISEQGRNDQRAVQRTVDAAMIKKREEQEPSTSDNTESAWNNAWESNPELRAEFGQNRDIWISYCKANAQGLAKICTGGQTQFKSSVKAT